MIHYPFPNKENSMQDLRGDYVFSKIEPDKVEEIFEDAWSVGLRAAKDFLQKYGDAPLRMQQFLREQRQQQQQQQILTEQVTHARGGHHETRTHFCRAWCL